jgi:hypothetical protein
MSTGVFNYLKLFKIGMQKMQVGIYITVNIVANHTQVVIILALTGINPIKPKSENYLKIRSCLL